MTLPDAFFESPVTLKWTARDLGGLAAQPLPRSPVLVAGDVRRVADDLDVRASRAPRDAGVHGGVVLALDEVLAPTRIDELARRATTSDDRTVRSA